MQYVANFLQPEVVIESYTAQQSLQLVALHGYTSDGIMFCLRVGASVPRPATRAEGRKCCRHVFDEAHVRKVMLPVGN